ncbi:MAG: hypothetical protein M1445_08490 [Bacteroidetes bacterium]|nr:hypothetical protein [Bacteroidota bacterium]
MGYKTFAYNAKSPVKSEDIGPGQIGIQHLNPGLFLEIQLVKTHTHTGVDSQKLTSDATPYMVRGYKLEEREERGTATWTGSASPSGSIVLTFGNKFSEIPTVIATPAGGDANIQVVVGSVSATGVTIYWKDDTGANQTSVPINWLAKGRM